MKYEDSPTGQWRLARIIELPKGAEVRIRMAKIFLSKEGPNGQPVGGSSMRGRGRNTRFRWQRGGPYGGNRSQVNVGRGPNRGRRGRGRSNRLYGGSFSAQFLRVMVEEFGRTGNRGFF